MLMRTEVIFTFGIDKNQLTADISMGARMKEFRYVIHWVLIE